MTPEEAHAQIVEAKVRSDTMDQTTVLLNLFHQYLKAESESDLEKALEDELNRVVIDLVKQGEQGYIGQIIFSMCAIVCNTCDPEAIQEFLDDESKAIQRLVDEASGDHTH